MVAEVADPARVWLVLPDELTFLDAAIWAPSAAQLTPQLLPVWAGNQNSLDGAEERQVTAPMLSRG